MAIKDEDKSHENTVRHSKCVNWNDERKCLSLVLALTVGNLNLFCFNMLAVKCGIFQWNLYKSDCPTVSTIFAGSFYL